MHHSRIGSSGLITALLGSVAFSGSAVAQQPSDVAPAAVDEIIVTAQKRAERINDVPLSISAASARTLANVGVANASDLAKVAPGFTATETATAVPVYSIRGIGYYDSALSATPAVTVYTDQVPLVYPSMTRNAVFDLERVEVLKGPQGTLFGQNSTGGAINFIAAKPTSTMQAGGMLTVGRFDQINGEAYLSGPVSDTFKVRLAVGHDSRGNWQYSYARPNDGRGKVDVTKGRLTLDWQPTSALHLVLTGSGWIDNSDTQAPQFIAKTSNLPQVPLFINYPLAPENPRAADWTPGNRKARDDSFYQIALRGDYELGTGITLTSITAFSKLKIDAPIDGDGTALVIDDYLDRGTVRTFNQELRVQAEMGQTRIIVGGNYSNDTVHQNTLDSTTNSSTAINTSVPGFPINQIRFLSDQNGHTLAGFANIEQQFGNGLTLQGGLRYTHSKRHFTGCFADVGGAVSIGIGGLANFLRSLQGLGPVTLQPDSCISLDAQFAPTTAAGNLTEHNLSFRFGPKFQISKNSMIYANISKGYKAGTFPTIGGVSVSQFTPTQQESVLAYEAGFKTEALDRAVQINGAAFYYDYTNKQLLGAVSDVVFTSLQKLVNVPKSRIYGAELQISSQPVTGLSLNGGVTYVNSKVTKSFFNYNPYGSFIDFKGESFPFTPKWQAVFDAQYALPVSDRWNVFLGGNALYNSRTVGSFGAGVPYNPQDPQHFTRFGQSPALSIVRGALDIKAYTVFDLRLGFENADRSLNVTFWGRNVTNKYYWTNATFVPADTTTRYAGMPRTVGVTLRYRYGH